MILQLLSYMKTNEAIDKLRDVIRLRHFSLSTEQCYSSWLLRFSKFVKERCLPDWKPAQKMGLDITPHHLRHAYATHCLNSGQNPRAIQQAMGHSQLETTMGYLHAEALSVKSPLEFQPV